jgi:ureidoacrylate peracid hydrolase
MIELRPHETALLVIDAQNGMCHPGGTLGQSGVDVTHLQRIVPRIARLVEVCRQAGIADIWSRELHYPHDVSRDAHRIPPHTLKRARIPCQIGTWDAEIVDELKPLIRETSHVIDKHRWSAFHGTRLSPLLSILGTRLIIVCGAATNTCVDTTVRDAYMRDFDVLIVSDCVAGVDESWHDVALAVWAQYVGALTTLDELTQALRALAR